MAELSVAALRLSAQNVVGAITLLLPRFDALVGTLVGVRFRVDGVVTGSLAMENLEARSTTVAVTLPAGLSVQLPSGTDVVGASSNGLVPLATQTLGAFDGVADFSGASGISLDGLAAGFTNQETRFDAATLDALTGTGDVPLLLTGNLWLRAAGGANARLETAATLDAAVTVEYGYVPAGTAVDDLGGGGTFGSIDTFASDFTSLAFLPPVEIATAPQRFIFADRVTGWRDGFAVAQFDPTLGTLDRVEIRLVGNIAGGVAVENHSGAFTAQANQAAALALTWADGTATPLSARAELGYSAALGAADGVDDFAGVGGWTSAGLSATGRNTLTIRDAPAGTRTVDVLRGSQVAGTGDPVTLRDGGDFGRFVGSGAVTLGLESVGSGFVSGTQANILAQMQASGGAQVEVVYHYRPFDPANVVGAAGDTIKYRGVTTDGDVTIAVGAGGRLDVAGTISARDLTIFLGDGATIAGDATVVASGTVLLTGPSVPGAFDFLHGGFPPVGFGEVSLAAVCPVIDTRTNQAINVVTTSYAGPVALVEYELVRITAENLNVAPGTDNWFIRTGHGTDAIAAHGGTNVLDGGGGSNFLTGAGGHDTFFLDARAAVDDVWSTVAQFASGDAVTIWGLTDAATTLAWQDDQGAPGATGLTLHASLAGHPTMSLTLAGYSTADLTNGRVTTGTGVVEGNAYLYLSAV